MEIWTVSNYTELAVKNRTLITVVADAKVLLVQLTGDLIMNGFLCKIKKLDVVDSFCYLGDTIGAGGGCDLSVITRI